MIIRKVLALLLGKLILKFTRILQRGGGFAAPGYYALKIYPNLVSDFSKLASQNIIITGTNGKTTTSKMLSHIANFHNLKVIKNHTGSNLERGIASTLIQNITFGDIFRKRGDHSSFDLGIWEVDEAAFNQVADKLNPKLIVFLNVFRDQLDRYGEIDSVVANWAKKLESLNKNTLLLINGDDHNLDKLSKKFEGQIQYFGLGESKIVGEKSVHQIKEVSLDFKASNIISKDLNQILFDLKFNQTSENVIIPIPGIYQIYDFLAAFGCSYNLNLKVKPTLESIKSFTPAFGRVEKFILPDSKLEGFIFLIKNPTGANQVIDTIIPQIKKEDRILLGLNDNLADGTDVSWIWDVEFEKIIDTSRAKSRDIKIYVSGQRALDLAVRLKYTEVSEENIIVEPDLESALKKSEEGLKGRLFILPTYTVLMELQNILVSKGLKSHYWKED